MVKPTQQGKKTVHGNSTHLKLKDQMTSLTLPCILFLLKAANPKDTLDKKTKQNWPLSHLN